MCSTNPCGSNALCDNGICTCLPEFYGDPSIGCRPECVLNSDCPRDKACVQNKCKSFCPGPCAYNAQCMMVNHIAMCNCPTGFEGNAFIQCNPIQGISICFIRNCFAVTKIDV